MFKKYIDSKLSSKPCTNFSNTCMLISKQNIFKSLFGADIDLQIEELSCSGITSQLSKEHCNTTPGVYIYEHT